MNYRNHNTQEKTDLRDLIETLAQQALAVPELEHATLRKNYDDTKVDIYSTTNNRIGLEYSTIDKWDDLVWNIRRGKAQQIHEELVMDQSFSIEAVLKENGDQALHVCTEFNRLKLFEWFRRKYNANVMSANYYGETPFHMAAKENRMDILLHYKENQNVYFQEFGFKVDHKAADGWSAAMFAAINTNITILVFLVT